MNWYDINSEIESNEKKVHWTEHNVYYLVLLYQQHPCLWKKDNPLYLNYYARRLAYQTIYEEVPILNTTIVEVIMKLREVRKTYVDELQKIVEAETFGLSYKSQYSWFDKLNDFLCTYLHFDEIEIIESSLKEDYYRQIYYEENEPRNLTLDTLSSKIFESSDTSRPSSSLSTKLVKTLRRPHLDVDDNASVTQIGKDLYTSTQNFSENSLSNLHSDLKIQLTPRGTKSDAEPDDVTVSPNESIQSIRINEGSMETISMQSWATARISCDQFDLFGSNVACRLKQMKPDAATTAQMEIQRVLTTVARDTESNMFLPSNSNASDEESDDSTYNVIPIFPYSEERNWSQQLFSEDFVT